MDSKAVTLPTGAARVSARFLAQRRELEKSRQPSAI